MNKTGGRVRCVADLRCKTRSVLNGSKKRLDHFSVDEVTAELVQLCQPEVVPGVVGVLRVVWIAAQITKVLHQHKCCIKLGADQVWIFSHSAQHLRSRFDVGSQINHE